MFKRREPEHQTSAGGVVYQVSSTPLQVCLVGRRVGKRLIWCLPKGHVEQGERLEETALREVREETGLDGDLIEPLSTISYQFKEPAYGKIHKTVHFFLIRHTGGNLQDHDDEVECAEWFPIKMALAQAEYPGERDVLKIAQNKIEGNS